MKQAIGHFAIRHAASIGFIVFALCVGGAYAAFHMPSSIFPQVNFPRVMILADNGIMPADEMMASVTRPIEEAMKDIIGCKTVRSITGRGTAEIDVFFDWSADMIQSEIYVQNRLSQLHSSLPATVNTSTYRMTFSVFPIIGLSLTSPHRDTTELWELARYTIKPKLLRINGIASVELVGGGPPEYHVVANPARLAALHLSLAQVIATLEQNNVVMPVTMHEQDQGLYLTVVDGRLHSAEEIAALPLSTTGPNPIRLGDVATVSRGATPAFSKVTANGTDSVLLNIFSHPDASTIDIARQVQGQLTDLRRLLPKDVHVEFFYDQSLLVRDSVASMWEAIAFGLLLSVVIVYLFLRDWGSTFVATLAIPVSVLFTILAMKLCGLTFNLMTLGGIAAVIGLVIDDAIVVVEAIYAKLGTGLKRQEAVRAAISDIFAPLLGSTLTPVVVFIPLAFLDGISGVFFRALALTMTVALLTSLVLALTLIPSLAARIVRGPRGQFAPELEQAQQSGLILRALIRLYELTMRQALRHSWFTIGLCCVVLFSVVVMYSKLQSDFLPAMDEGGFVIDYIAPAGTSLTEIDRQLRGVEKILQATPEVESYSRRAGQGLGVALVEPNIGDFLVKLKADRKRSTQEVITDVRARFNIAVPRFEWQFPGILSDLIGDLTWEDQPIEIKLFSTDTEFLKRKDADILKSINNVPGVVDVTSGIHLTGPSIRLKVRVADAERFGLSAQQIGSEVNAMMLGQTATSILQDDRLVNVRVKEDDRFIDQLDKFRELPLRAADGTIIRLRHVADVVQTPGELELHRDDLRQDIAITANLQGRDMGGAIGQLRNILNRDPELPPGSIEFGGLFEQQQDAFAKLTVVLTLAILLVFTVALLEFRSFTAPISIVFGAALSMFGIVTALKLTGTTVSIVTFLGAIIGMGIVHKNGILMLDYVHQLQERGMALREALVYSGRRRLRPVLMTCLAAAMGMLPLAYGIGSGTDMLRPMAIAVIGAVCISVLLSLIATPTMYYSLTRLREFLFPQKVDRDAPQR